jgi:uncharacterized OB-fold protein
MMIARPKCPKCEESLLAWERVPHKRAVEKAVRNNTEPKTGINDSGSIIIYCAKCGHILRF